MVQFVAYVVMLRLRFGYRICILEPLDVQRVIL
jgi:hypothetical protein